VESAARTVSVVVPTYRKKELLACTLNSLSAQTYPHDLVEVVVVDDCSEDGTGEFLEGVEAPYRVLALRHETNRGRAAARNTGIAAASGEIVVFLDDDMRADPRLLSSHVRFHDAHPNAAAIGNAVTAPELGDSLLFRYIDSRGVHKLPPGGRSPARYFVTNNASVPRRALTEAGLFDEAFRSYGFEDTELAFRLEERAGVSFWYLREALAQHIHYHSVDQFLEKRRTAARSSLSYLLEKHPGRARDLSVEALLPPSRADGSGLRLRKLVVALLMARPFTVAARRLVEERWLGRAAYPVFDYLIGAAYYRGLREAAVSPVDSGTERAV
jgi:glycosyltransferase involved in cell wall biosynthesis